MRAFEPNSRLYPFGSHFFNARDGRMHYVDEGSGAPIVFVHGTPTWSFLWRDLIRELRGEWRCVAPDHLGFGLSDKPRDPSALSVRAHADNLEQLLDSLDLQDVTLVVHDFGGPIGLSWALAQPERVSRVVLLNTWLWSNAGNKPMEAASRLLGGPIGRFLYLNLNFSVKTLLRSAFADKRRLSAEAYRHYLAPLKSRPDRLAPWVLAGQLTGANDWYERLWEKRRELASKPLAVIWGKADTLMPPSHLERWRAAFPAAEIHELEGVGHFVPEEAPGTARLLRTFLRGADQVEGELTAVSRS